MMSAKESIKLVMPQTMIKRAGDMRRRLRNAATMLQTGEAGYRLGIERFGDFTVAFRTGTSDVEVLEDRIGDAIFAAIPDYYTPQPDDDIIDVGAHIGSFALQAASKVPHGRVFAIEASQESFNYLRVNIALNQAFNITPVHMALADTAGVTTLHHDEGNWGHSITKQWSSRGEQVVKNSLENFCTAHQISQAGFIKFNCEGAEFPILLNTSIDVLQKFRRMLVLYHLDLAQGYTRKSLIDHLQGAGFQTTMIRDEGPRGWIDASR